MDRPNAPSKTGITCIRFPIFKLALGCFLCLTTSGTFSQTVAPPIQEPALWLRVIDSPAIWEHVINLCQGTAYESPAVALAAAKAAGLQPLGGNKTLEAGVSLFNHAIVPDLSILNQLVVALAPNLQSRSIDWRVAIGNDDGMADALVTAMALDQSMPEPDLAGAKVERIGSGLLAARSPAQIWFAPNRTVLEAAIVARTDQKLLAQTPPLKSGIWLRADPRQWPRGLGRNAQENITLEALRRLSGNKAVDLRSFPWGESVQTEVLDLLRLLPSSPVQPQWLGRWEPALAGRLMAQVSVGLDPRKPFWNEVFTLVTGLERTLPGRDRVANLRDRINIGALLARVSPETDLYPNLIGLTLGAVLPDTAASPPTVVATLHARDVRATQILVEKVVVPVIRTIGGDPKSPRAGQPQARSDANIRGLAVVGGRPIFLFLESTDICLVWGARNVAEAVAARQQNANETISMKWLNQFAKNGPVHRAASVYPDALVGWQRLKGEPATPWTNAAKNLPPMVWVGRSTGAESRDIIAFSGVRAYVQSLLSAIPPTKKAAE